MSDDVAIKCDGVSKTYVIRDWSLRSMVNAAFGGSKHKLAASKQVQALSDVSFDVKRGEVFGIVGGNGAGKSTLLSCIAGVTQYDAGAISVNGHVDTVLKVGVGFHPNLTGRENALIGAISTGFSVQEAKDSIEDILAFAELEKFGDMPFYTYSSGMQARLQFAVSVHRTPDILILDEALATGDTQFMHKSLRRIENICHSGSTVLFVTHTIGLLEMLCDRVLWLERGCVVDIGLPHEIAPRYLEAAAQQNGAAIAEGLKKEGGDTGSGEVVLRSVTVNGEAAPVVNWREPLVIEAEIESLRAVDNVEFRMLISSANDEKVVAAIWNEHANERGEFVKTKVSVPEGKSRICFHIPHCPFGRNVYLFSLSLLPASSTTSAEDPVVPFVHRARAGSFRVRSFPTASWDAGRTVVTEPCVRIDVVNA